MTRDCVHLGSTPSEEDCQQVGPTFDPTKAEEECRRYIALLEETFPVRPAGVKFRIKWETHDFGRYPEVVLWYDMDDETQRSFAYHVEDNTPQKWKNNPPPPRKHGAPPTPKPQQEEAN